MTEQAGIVGWPLGHSLSPAIFARAFAARGLDWRYEAFPISPEELPREIARLAEENLRGFNVTIPHKEAVIPFLDGLSEEAREIGAVNCVTREGAAFIGCNTDRGAFRDTLRDVAGFRAAGKRAVVLGAGGAARAVLYALAEEGVEEITLLARDPDRARRAGRPAAKMPGTLLRFAPLAPPRVPEIARALREAHLLVNSTPVGMAGAAFAGGIPCDDSELFRPGLLVYDLVYRPRRTPLLRHAETRGAATMGGLPMLAFQAAEAFTRWTGEAMSGTEMLEFAETEDARTQVEDATRG